MSNIKILAKNKRARFEYEIEDTMECGIQLKGTEVKSMRGGKFSFKDSFADIKNNEVFLYNFHITPYAFEANFNHLAERPRKLLLHAQEIKRLQRKINEKGNTLVPLSFYFKGGLIKVELALCRGKKIHDKRNAIKDRDQKREVAREFRQKFK